MKKPQSSRRRLRASWALAVWFWGATALAENDDWSGDLEFYGWLPEIKNETVNGGELKISPSDILSNLDSAFMAAGRIRKNRWSLSTDVIYFKISDGSIDSSLLLPGLLSVGDPELEASIITPNVGYTIIDNDQQKIELYAGARYFWIEVDVTLYFDPQTPGQSSSRTTETISEKHWDGIVGARGLYYLSDKWYIPYSVNAGAGDSDFTWSAQTGGWL